MPDTLFVPATPALAAHHAAMLAIVERHVDATLSDLLAVAVRSAQIRITTLGLRGSLTVLIGGDAAAPTVTVAPVVGTGMATVLDVDWDAELTEIWTDETGARVALRRIDTAAWRAVDELAEARPQRRPHVRRMSSSDGRTSTRRRTP